MNNTNDNDTFEEMCEKTLKLPAEEIKKYSACAFFISRVIDILGISVMVVACMFPGIILGCICAVTLYALAETGVLVDNARKSFKEKLADLSDK